MTTKEEQQVKAESISEKCRAVFFYKNLINVHSKRCAFLPIPIVEVSCLCKRTMRLCSIVPVFVLCGALKCAIIGTRPASFRAIVSQW